MGCSPLESFNNNSTLLRPIPGHFRNERRKKLDSCSQFNETVDYAHFDAIDDVHERVNDAAQHRTERDIAGNGAQRAQGKFQDITPGMRCLWNDWYAVSVKINAEGTGRERKVSKAWPQRTEVWKERERRQPFDRTRSGHAFKERPQRQSPGVWNLSRKLEEFFNGTENASTLANHNYRSSRASENLEPGHGQTVGFGLALAWPGSSHGFGPKPEKAKTELKGYGCYGLLARGQSRKNTSYRRTGAAIVGGNADRVCIVSCYRTLSVSCDYGHLWTGWALGAAGPLSPCLSPCLYAHVDEDVWEPPSMTSKDDDDFEDSVDDGDVDAEDSAVEEEDDDE
ncbi:hypothetical protein DFH08DRAFT_996555 [Mycena albidolilacea]|uniref:Uncharacterized protein n=2 Tax=Mycena albidolilacea TaxID=1033008 RepID=A0AAD6YX60_9AGAR|nr:hypothetical protein DFH08DRAFT_996555 [Mycena albidolilacea]